MKLDSALKEWKAVTGKKFIYFEHHCEVYYGMKFDFDYDKHTARNFRVIDEKKYLLYLLKHDTEHKN